MQIVEVAPQSMLASKPPRIQYSEVEAAALLGISVERLRTLVQDHIVKEDGAGGMVIDPTFQPSDLLVLRILAGMHGA